MVERWSPKAKDRVDFDSENSLFYGDIFLNLGICTKPMYQKC